MATRGISCCCVSIPNLSWKRNARGNASTASVACQGHIRAAPKGWHRSDGADSECQGVKPPPGGDTGDTPGCRGEQQGHAALRQMFNPSIWAGRAGCGSRHTPRIPTAGTAAPPLFFPGCASRRSRWALSSPRSRRESGAQHPDKREPLAPVASGHGLALLPRRSQGPCGADGASGLSFHPCPSWAHVSLSLLLHPC